MRQTQTYYCESCSKVTTRLLGTVVGVELREGGATTRSNVLGYCAAHRDVVLPEYLASLEPLGTVILLSDPPAELRPATAGRFLAWADRNMSLAFHEDALTSEAKPPERCPHCRGSLSWGTGPHVADALQRDAFAWECRQCGAAGLLTRT